MTILVTGAATGIGRAISERLLDDGFVVVGIGLDEQEGRELEDTRKSMGHDFRFECLDVTKEDEVESFFRDVTALSGLVNCAGIYPLPQRIEDVPVSLWRAIIEVNLTGTFVVCRAAMPLLRAGGGSIVNVSSVHAAVSAPGQGAYGASKAGVAALTRQIAVDYAIDGIRANSILVGSVNTRITERAIEEAGSPEKIGLTFDQRSLGHIAEPDEVAAVVAFLLSSDASFITGSSLTADGGLVAGIMK